MLLLLLLLLLLLPEVNLGAEVRSLHAEACACAARASHLHAARMPKASTASLTATARPSCSPAQLLQSFDDFQNLNLLGFSVGASCGRAVGTTLPAIAA